jgi:hypothetical protein
MKKIAKFTLVFALSACLLAPSLSVQSASAQKFTSTPTHYTKASDVVYKKSGNYIANWGARGEDATFLSTYAQSFYTGSYTYEVLSEKSGGTSQSNGYQSALYAELQDLMQDKHKTQTS